MKTLQAYLWSMPAAAAAYAANCHMHSEANAYRM